MLSQDKLAFKIFYEGIFLGKLPLITQREIEKYMEECNLKYRKEKNYNDLLIAIGNVCKNRKNINDWLEKGAEEIDKILIRKNWNL